MLCKNGLFGLLIVEICKLFIMYNNIFLLLYDVLTIVYVCYYNWPLIVIPYDQWHIPYPWHFIGACMYHLHKYHQWDSNWFRSYICVYIG